jgi:hypothetical protein
LPSNAPNDLDQRLAEIRDLTRRFKLGDERSAAAFRDLCDRLLRTVLDHTSALQLFNGQRPNTYVLSGRGEYGTPLLLTDGRFLRLLITLTIADTPDGPRLKVVDSAFQYQMDASNDRWIFRYEYERNPPRNRPPTHFHLRGNLVEDCLSDAMPLERVHFPAIRISLESVIRLLIEQFKVHPNEPRSVWRRLLTESEREFIKIAHRPLSGPRR